MVALVVPPLVQGLGEAIELVGGSLVVDMLSPLAINGETIARWGPGCEGFTADDLAEFKSSEIDVFHCAFGMGGATYHDIFDNTRSIATARCGNSS